MTINSDTRAIEAQIDARIEARLEYWIEQLGRLCYGIEISPAYCAVILQRMTDAGMEPYRKD